MSSFGGVAWIDLVSGADAELVLSALDVGEGEVAELPGGRHRIVAGAIGMSGDVWYGELAEAVVRLAERTGWVSHAFIAFDHDEYGAEHIVLEVSDGNVRRAYHYYAHPRNWWRYFVQGEPSAVVSLPAVELTRPGKDPGVLVDGRVARATVSQLYGVPVSAVKRAATADASAHRSVGIIGAPCEHWRDALGLPWPGGDRVG